MLLPVTQMLLPVTETEETKCWWKEEKSRMNNLDDLGEKRTTQEVASKPALKDETKKEKAFQAEGVTGKEGRGAHRD